MKYITIVKWACHTGRRGTDIGNWEHVKDQKFLVQYISKNEILNHKYSINISIKETVDKNSKSALNLINISIKE